MNMKKLMKRPVVMAGAGLGQYLLTRRIEVRHHHITTNPKSSQTLVSTHTYTQTSVTWNWVTYLSGEWWYMPRWRNITWVAHNANPSEINLQRPRLYKNLTTHWHPKSTWPQTRFVLNQWWRWLGHRDGDIFRWKPSRSRCDVAVQQHAVLAIGWNEKLDKPSTEDHEAQANDMTREQT